MGNEVETLVFPRKMVLTAFTALAISAFACSVVAVVRWPAGVGIVMSLVWTLLGPAVVWGYQRLKSWSKEAPKQLFF